MDVQRETYAAIAMARADAGEPDLYSVVDAALVLYEAEGLPDHRFYHQNGGRDEIDVGGLAGLLADAQNPLPHALTHAGAGADPILSLGAHDITGNAELQNNVDLLFAVNLGSNIGTFAVRADNIFAENLYGVGDGADGRCLLYAYQASNSGPVMQFTKARGTRAAPALVQANDELGIFLFRGYYNGANTATGARIAGFAAENWLLNNYGSSLRFHATDVGDAAQTEYMRLDGNGETVDTYKRLDIRAGTAVLGANGITGWADDGANFRLTFTDGIITAVANSVAGGHS